MQTNSGDYKAVIADGCGRDSRNMQQPPTIIAALTRLILSAAADA